MFRVSRGTFRPVINCFGWALNYGNGRGGSVFCAECRLAALKWLFLLFHMIVTFSLFLLFYLCLNYSIAIWLCILCFLILRSDPPPEVHHNMTQVSPSDSVPERCGAHLYFVTCIWKIVHYWMCNDVDHLFFVALNSLQFFIHYPFKILLSLTTA
jgi:hypothetical protein